jgi:hypothetical protein
MLLSSCCYFLACSTQLQSLVLERSLQPNHLHRIKRQNSFKMHVQGDGLRSKKKHRSIVHLFPQLRDFFG